MISIAATDEWIGDLVVDELRIYALDDYVARSGNAYTASRPREFGSQQNYLTKVTVATNDGVASIPLIEVEPTTDAIVNPGARLGAYWFLGGEMVAPFSVFRAYQQSHTPALTTWLEIAIRSDGEHVPSEVDGAVVWGMADRQTQADTAAVPSLIELSGSGATIANADVATQPTMKIENGERMIHHPGGGRGFVATYNQTIDVGKCTMFMVARADENEYGIAMLFAAKGQNDGAIAYDPATGLIGWYGSEFFPSPVKMSSAKFQVIGIRVDRNQGVTVRVNEQSHFRLQSYASNYLPSSPVLSTAGFIGGFEAGSALSFIGDHKSQLLINRPLPDDEMSERMDYFSKMCGVPFGAAPSVQFIIWGDSLETGALGDSFGHTPWPEKMMQQLPAVNSFNFGVQGQTTTDMLNHQLSKVLALLDPNKRNVVFLGGGTNDLWASVSNLATLQANFTAICTALKDHATTNNIPLDIIPFSLLPRGANAPFETTRQIYNTWQGAQASLYSVRADIGGDPDIGAPGSQTNTELYQEDETHLTDDGYAIKAGRALEAYMSLS